MSVGIGWVRSVRCVLCGSTATLKPTKTARLVLRCDYCGLLLFANKERAQQILLGLPSYQDGLMR
jgi:hypothetical protein